MKTIRYQQTLTPLSPVPIFDEPKWVVGPDDYGLVSPELLTYFQSSDV
jgi:hypothetical protein